MNIIDCITKEREFYTTVGNCVEKGACVGVSILLSPFSEGGKRGDVD